MRKKTRRSKHRHTKNCGCRLGRRTVRNSRVRRGGVTSKFEVAQFVSGKWLPSFQGFSSMAEAEAYKAQIKKLKSWKRKRLVARKTPAHLARLFSGWAKNPGRHTEENVLYENGGYYVYRMGLGHYEVSRDIGGQRTVVKTYKSKDDFSARIGAYLHCDAMSKARAKKKNPAFNLSAEDREANRRLLAQIRPGDRVTILVHAGGVGKSMQWKEKTGRAVMRGSHGWVLNMGGAHGTPGVASEENIVKVTRR